MSKKPGHIAEFWKKYLDDEGEVQNAKFLTALIKYLEEHENEENKENIKVPSFKNKKSRELFAKRVTNQIFWPDPESKENDIVTKASIIFACKKSTFGPFITLFQTISENLSSTDLPFQPIDFFWGHSDLSRITKRLKKEKSYCMRYHDDGGFEICIRKVVEDGSDPSLRRERIKRMNLKSKGVIWRWEEQIAMIQGMKINKHDFGSVGAWLKELKDKEIIEEPVMYGTAYRSYVDKKNKNRDHEVDNAFKGMRS